jgi:hypothetical protein
MDSIALLEIKQEKNQGVTIQNRNQYKKPSILP